MILITSIVLVSSIIISLILGIFAIKKENISSIYELSAIEKRNGGKVSLTLDNSEKSFDTKTLNLAYLSFDKFVLDAANQEIDSFSININTKQLVLKNLYFSKNTVISIGSDIKSIEIENCRGISIVIHGPAEGVKLYVIGSNYISSLNALNAERLEIKHKGRYESVLYFEKQYLPHDINSDLRINKNVKTVGLSTL